MAGMIGDTNIERMANWSFIWLPRNHITLIGVHEVIDNIHVIEFIAT